MLGTEEHRGAMESGQTDRARVEGYHADVHVTFDTPENVVFGYELAGIGSRFLAAFVDTLLIVLLQLVVNVTLLLAVAAVVGDGSLLALEVSGGISLWIAVMGLAAFALLWGYYIFFETLWNGQSPGKRLVGLRVIRREGIPIDVFAALIRNLVRVIDFLPLYYGVGVVTMFVDEKSRRLGDFAAGTLVVYDRGVISLEDLEKEHTPFRKEPGQQADGQPLPVERLPMTHVMLARQFVGRQHELYNRRVLAVSLAERLREAMGLPPESLTEQQALALVEAVATVENATPD